jgi:alkanesulfonate monooxygenase SsuD/methylene tetrahydromethanopterin reductase-like flavin-dependent oxidoreductase (luciferase family)
MVACGYGTYLGAGAAVAVELRQEVQLAEAAGFDAILFSEHHDIAGYPPAPLAMASFALGASTSLRAGAMPLLLPLHHPVRVAEEAALLDVASDGRLILGLAAGYLGADFAQTGLSLAERQSRLIEGVRLMRNVWSDHPHSHSGQHYQFSPPGPLRYPPARQGGVPVWIGGTAESSLQLAAESADGIVLTSLSSDAELVSAIGRYRSMCQARNRGQGTVAVMRRSWLGPRDETDRFLASFARELKALLESTDVARPNWSRDLDQEAVTHDFLNRRALVGRPEEVAENAHAWAKRLDVDYVILKLQFGARSFELLREHCGGRPSSADGSQKCREHLDHSSATVPLHSA